MHPTKRRSNRLQQTIILASAIGCLVSCSSATPRVGFSGPKARDYAPLPVGASFTYDVKYPGQSGEMTVHLVSESPDGYVLDDRNGAFRHTAHGLRDRDRYLIRHPLRVGHTWESMVGPSAKEKMEITKIGSSCDTGAGHFEDCLEVTGRIQRDRNMSLRITWTWARSVGLVGLKTEAELPGKGTVPQVSQSLKRYRLEPTTVDASAHPEEEPGPDTWTKE